MQAIILAAGMGRRLGEYTKDQTKCMVPVNGVRLIDRVLGQLSKLQLQRVIIVTGYKGKELRDYITTQYGQQLTGNCQLQFAENPVYDKTNNIYSLSLVKDQLQEDDTLLIESDLISVCCWTTHTPTWPSLPSTRHGWMARWCAWTTNRTS